MPRKSKSQRTGLVRAKGLELGLPEQHSQVLAKVSCRRGLDSRVCYLIDHFEGYAEMMELYRELKNDPVAFNNRYKSMKLIGQNKFSRYGTLSAMYSNASPIQAISVLIKDALDARDMAKTIRILDGRSPKNGEEYPIDFFESRKFSRLENAFRQDLRGNKIPDEVVKELLRVLNWDNAPIKSSFGLETDRIMIMDAVYVFFSSREGGEFLKEWEKPDTRGDIIDEFTYRFFNDPKLNTYLVDGKPEDIGTEKFEKSCNAFFDSTVYLKDGTPTRRAELDLRSLSLRG